MEHDRLTKEIIALFETLSETDQRKFIRYLGYLQSAVDPSPGGRE